MTGITRTEKIQKAYWSTVFRWKWGRAMAWVVSRRPLTAMAQVHARVSPVVFVVDKVALGQVFIWVLWFSPVNIIPLWAPHFKKLKKIVLSLIHSFSHSLIHSHPGTNNRPVKAAAVQWDISLTPIIRIRNRWKWSGLVMWLGIGSISMWAMKQRLTFRNQQSQTITNQFSYLYQTAITYWCHTL
jgi:hypothetical protein